MIPILESIEQYLITLKNRNEKPALMKFALERKSKFNKMLLVEMNSINPEIQLFPAQVVIMETTVIFFVNPTHRQAEDHCTELNNILINKLR